MTRTDNKVATALFVVGVLSITVGIMSGLYYGSQGGNGEFGQSQARIGWGIFIDGLIWGIVFFGFSEVIKLLQGIFNQREPGVSTSGDAPAFESEMPVSEEETNTRKISENEKNTIQEYYDAQGKTVEDIELTEKEDFFVVTVGGKKELIELGGFKPIIHPYKN
ncbi:MAG: hypothetical protein ACQEUT_16725 [Bacillota bacterium]